MSERIEANKTESTVPYFGELSDKVGAFAILPHDLNEQPKSLLSREAYLLGGGIKDGFMDRLNQARENPGLTALEFTGAAAIGAGLTAMSMAGGRWATAARVGTAALQGLAIADLAIRGASTVCAMGDTALNPDHYLKNRALVADNLGTASFDYPLMAAGGMLGSSAVDLAPKAISSFSERLSGKAMSFEAAKPKIEDFMRWDKIMSEPGSSMVAKTYSDTRILVFPALWASQSEEKIELQKR